MPRRLFFCLLSSTVPGGDHVPDGELLQRFAQDRDAVAFELLVRRHADTVWTACRRVLRSESDAEDVFQATFLVLARNAATVRGATVGGWLHRVAVNAALKLRQRSARVTVATAEQLAALPAPAPDDSDPSLSVLVQEELANLPERYRLPVVLCELEGCTHAEAATVLGWPVGSVSSRLSRARGLLRARLARRGVSAPALVLPAVGLPPTLVRDTTAIAVGTASVPPPVLTLTKGVLSSMHTAKLKLIAIGLVAVGLTVLAGSGMFTALGRGPAPADRTDRTTGVEPPRDKGSGGDKKTDRGEDAAAKELKTLQGDWKVVGLETEGRKASEDDVKGMRWTFKGTQLQATDPGEQPHEKSEIKLTPDKNPKHIDLIILEGGRKGEKLLGIYKLEQGRLTICLRNVDATQKGRPTEFTAEKGSDQGIIILEPHKQAELEQVWKELFTVKREAELTAVAIGKDRLATADETSGSEIRVCDATTGKNLGARSVPGVTATADNPVRWMRFLSDGTTLLYVSGNSGGSAICRMDVSTKDGGDSFPLGNVCFVGASGDGKIGVAILVNPADRVTLNAPLFNNKVSGGDGVVDPLGRTLTHAALSADDRLLATVNSDAVLRVHDRQTKKELHRIAFPSGTVITDLKLSDDGKRLVVAGEKGFTKVFDSDTGKELCDLKGHDGRVNAAAFTPDGSQMATACEKVVRVYGATTGKLLAGFAEHTDEVTVLAFAQDGRRLATGSKDKTAKVWERK